jgi:hypothetical protein
LKKKCIFVCAIIKIYMKIDFLSEIFRFVRTRTKAEVIFLILFIFNTSCNVKSTSNCEYNIIDHESYINDSTIFIKYSDSLFYIYDERVDNMGFVYYFKKENGMLNDCVFYFSDSVSGLSKRYNTQLNTIEKNGNSIFYYYYTKEKTGIRVVIYYNLMGEQIKNAKFEQDKYSIDVKINKDSSKTHEYYSSIFLNGTKEEELKISKLYFFADIINCDGKIEKIKEKIVFN